MIFNKLTVTNLGNFAGTHELDLQPRNRKSMKPIILFGGLNGAGKTTIFDAIKLCLYGAEMFGPLAAGKYLEYLREKIHQSKVTVVQANSAAIILEFDYTQQGTVCTYRVERRWEVSGAKVREHLVIGKNGLPLDEVEKSAWQDFIKEIIPFGLSQLFFFDGEKIQKMMTDDSNEELKRSILSLLGLDVVERLQADLKIYRGRFLQEGSGKIFAEEIAELEAQLELMTANSCKINDAKAGLENSIAQLGARIGDYRNKIAAQGEGYYRNRVQLEKRKSSLEHEVEALKERLRELAAGLLPAAIAAPAARRLKQQVVREESQKNSSLLAESLEEKCRELLARIDAKSFLPSGAVSPSSWKTIKDKLKAEIATLFAPEKSGATEAEIYGYSPRQASELVQAIDLALEAIPAEMAVVTNSHELKFRELQATVTKLAKVPDDEFIRPMYETLDQLNVELGGLTEKRANFDEQLLELGNGRSELERKIELLNRKIASTAKLDEKLQSVLQVEQVLGEYYRQLAKEKISGLQEEFTRIFRMLHRKEDMIARIKIDPRTFAVALYDGQENSIGKSSLSSGELEIYAMSMLWALAKTSGQKLPFIVDTPLARLDSKHRDNLVQLFFPHASQQMIIFSTNTEVDNQYFDQLKPYVGKAYNLEYCETSKSTVVKEGYFWK